MNKAISKSKAIFLTNFLLLACSSFAIGQTVKTNFALKFPSSSILSKKYVFKNSFINQPTENKAPASLRSLMMQEGIPQKAQYNCNELAFFCRLEVKIEKAAKFPVKFRIGDVQQVDLLEGKYEGWRYGY